MNKLILLFTVLYSFTIDAKQVKGLVVIDGKSQEVYLEVPYSEKDKLLYDNLCDELEVYDADGKTYLPKPSKISRIEFTDEEYGNLVLVAINKKGQNYPVGHYYLTIEEGEILLLRYVKIMNAGDNGSNYGPSNHFLYSKEIGLIRVNGFNFKKKVLKNLKTCKKLNKMLSKRDYRLSEMKNIIKVYNQSCI